MTSFTHASLDYHPTSRGSLPLKKRKLYHFAVTPEIQKQPSIIERSTTPRVHPEEVDSSLALLAAASGVLTRMPPAGLRPRPLPAISIVTTAQDRCTPPPYTVLRTCSSSAFAFHDSNGFGPSPVTPIGTEMHETPASQSGTAGSHRPSRVHHPPLSAPLSNGCHGRTSRNNSFCRRTPCYKGSTYCKLHYQQYVVAGTRLPLEPTATSEPNSITSTPTIHQDKRYTGCDDVRCVATTTRGRACAYASVSGTKYCYLHASYDTHPPPRRGGGSSSAASTPKPEHSMLATVARRVEITPSIQGCPSLPDLGTGKRLSIPSLQHLPYESGNSRHSPSSVSSDDSYAVSSHGFDTSNPDAQSPVLLSSISSDQWLDRKVKFASGPFVNRIGIVEKWGNGWVTVRVNGELTHNRRSIELYLVPQSSNSDNDDGSKHTSISPAASSDAEGKVANNKHLAIAHADHGQLSHSISVDQGFPDNTILEMLNEPKEDAPSVSHASTANVH